MPALTPVECRAFALSIARPAILGTVRADGRPHIAPVWIDIQPGDGVDQPDTILFNTGANTVKGRNLARDPRVTLSVDDDKSPFTYVVADGVAQLSDDLTDVREWATRIGGRYLGRERAEAMGARNGVPGELLVRVRVTRWFGYAGVSD